MLFDRYRGLISVKANQAIAAGIANADKEHLEPITITILTIGFLYAAWREYERLQDPAHNDDTFWERISYATIDVATGSLLAYGGWASVASSSITAQAKCGLIRIDQATRG
jgi:hypothetical protein